MRDADHPGALAARGQSFRDDLIRVFVDVADAPESREYFVEDKECLKARFQQLDIWMTTYLIEVLYCGCRSGLQPDKPQMSGYKPDL